MVVEVVESRRVGVAHEKRGKRVELVVKREPIMA